MGARWKAPAPLPKSYLRKKRLSRFCYYPPIAGNSVFSLSKESERKAKIALRSVLRLLPSGFPALA